MSALLERLQGRDTCSGACETFAGCDCCQRKLTEADLDAAQITHRFFTDSVAEEREAMERAAYRSGWHWGLVDGVLAGALAMAGLVKLGSLWGVL